MSEELRQLILKVMLPSLVLGVGYLLFYAQPMSKKLKLASVKLAKVQKDGPSTSSQRSKMIEAKTLPKTLETLKKKRATLRDLARQYGGNTSSLKRTQTIEAFAKVFKDHKLRLIQSGSAEKTALPQNIDWLVKQSNQGNAGESRELWQFEFYGRYLDAVKALDAVSVGPYQVVPVALNFDSKQANGVFQRWTIVIWV
ncbi:MAG: hypothetical protein P1V97_32705 [Planctomycetota bacterium]|nr:hypothetical protein [Planctomycetota bacterium]